jgi:carbonic anhydrase/acetyltransferase-like protein (isoleucine patch superfamily)
VWIAPSAEVIGDVEIGEESSIWFGAVVRGDLDSIRIGVRSNVQDLSMIHVRGGELGTVIGDDVTVGHSVVLHACTLGNRVLVGMHAVILDGAVVGDDVLIAAGSLVTPGTRIPSGVLAMGRPARPVHALRPKDRDAIDEGASSYVALAREYAQAGLGTS